MVRLSKSRRSVWIASLLCFSATQVVAVEHPGALSSDAVCTSCHAKQVSGVSVHAAMATPCTVCHVTKTQGDMTSISLSMPKEKICFACHEESSALRQHLPAVKGTCVDCHDAHSSDRKMLMRVAEVVPIPRHKRQ
jgi:predicted CXXCH cytochrome family protein